MLSGHRKDGIVALGGTGNLFNSTLRAIGSKARHKNNNMCLVDLGPDTLPRWYSYPAQTYDLLSLIYNIDVCRRWF